MDPGAFQSYYPTFLRYVIVGTATAGIMYGVYRLLRKLGVKQEAAAGFSLVLPWLLKFLVMNVFTIGISFYLSFTKYNLFKAPQWIGLENWERIFTGGDRYLGPSLRLTFTYAVISIPLGLIGALCVALLLNRDVKGIGFWRTLYYLPAVLPAAAVALLWFWLFAPTSGLVNWFLSPVYDLLHMDPLAWFTDRKLVLPSFVIMGLWGVFGANSVILLAGLKGIPRPLYDAAEIDGAGTWQKFRNVTLPMLTPTLFYNLVTGTIAALQIFTQQAFIPSSRRAGWFISYNVYHEAFVNRHMGYASALGWLLMIITVMISLLVFRSSDAWVFYEEARADRAKT